MFNKGEIDCDTVFKQKKQILTDEIEDEEFLEFVIKNFSEMMGYIATGRINIRILRDITGKIWFGVYLIQLYIAIKEEGTGRNSSCTPSLFLSNSFLKHSLLFTH